jgi:hypothetical protein
VSAALGFSVASQPTRRRVEIMLNTLPRFIVVAWLALVAAFVTVSVTMGANLSTAALVFALGVSPAIVALLIAGGVSSPSVAEILYAVDTKGGRR